MQKPHLFYDLRREREERWRAKGWGSMEISNLKRNRLGVFSVFSRPKRAHIVVSLYLVYTRKKQKAIDNDDDSN